MQFYSGFVPAEKFDVSFFFIIIFLFNVMDLNAHDYAQILILVKIREYSSV